MQRVGFVGLGAMGAPMAWNVRKAGFALGVYNRNAARAQPFQEAGVNVHVSPAALAAQSDVVITMVTDPAALRQVIARHDGVAQGIKPGALVINMSTVSPEATLEAAAAVTAKGARFVDAPVSGTVKPAEMGTLLILASGAKEDVEAAMPVLKAMGKEVIYCGATGQGTCMKLTLNLLLGNMMQLLAETLVFGRSLGLDATAILQAVAAGPMGAPLYQMKGQAMQSRSFAKQFSVDLMFKDLNLVLDAAGRSSVLLPLTAVTRELFSAARAKGYGDEDMAAICKLMEEIAAPAAAGR